MATMTQSPDCVVSAWLCSWSTFLDLGLYLIEDLGGV